MQTLLKVGLASALTLGCFAALPASAQVRSYESSAPSGPVNSKSASRDPNRVVCVTTDELGSRLGSKRVCHTAAEWVAYRRDIRNTVDKVQAMKPWQE